MEAIIKSGEERIVCGAREAAGLSGESAQAESSADEGSHAPKSSASFYLLLMAAFCTALMLNLPLVEALSISHSPISDVIIDRNNVQVSWITDVPGDTRIDYGDSISSLDKNYGNTEQSLVHSANLLGLEYDTVYYYKLTSHAPAQTAVSDNYGNLHTFRTSPEEGTPQVDTVPPVINASVPRYWRSTSIDISGTTDPYSWVKAYVNKEESAIGGFTQFITRADNNGAFVVRNVRITTLNEIVLQAEDPAGNKATESYTVEIDNEAPKIGFSLPGIASSNPAIWPGNTSEEVTVEVIIGNTSTRTQVTGDFRISGQLPEGQKTHVIVRFFDKGFNTVEYERDVIVDRQPPIFTWTNLQGLDPSYVQEVIVKGNASKPGINIVVFVNGETTSGSAFSTSLVDTVRRVGRIVEGEQGYNTVTADDGTFEVRVLLTKKFESTRREYAPYPQGHAPGDVTTQPSRDPLNTQPDALAGLQSLGTGWDNNITILAIDQLGRTTTSSQTVTFAQCGFGGDWNIQVGEALPTIITPEILNIGYAQLGFTINLDWQGGGDENKVKILSTPTVRSYTLGEEAKKSYAFDPSRIVGKINSLFDTSGYRDGSIIVNLNAINYSQKELQDIDPKDLLIRIPLQLEINYEYESLGRLIPAVQRQCWDVSTLLDVRVPPKKVIPDALLNDSIQALDAAVKSIDSILKPLETITIAVFVASILAGVFYFGKLVQEKMTCFSITSSATDDAKAKCQEAKDETAYYENVMHWVADRIFCPSVPMVDKYLNDHQGEGDICKGVLGNAAIAELKSDQRGIGEASVKAAKNDCGAKYMLQWDSACMGMDELKHSKCILGQAYNDDELIKASDCPGATGKLFYGAAEICEEKAQPQNHVISLQQGGKTETYCIKEDGTVSLGSARTLTTVEEGEDKIFTSIGDPKSGYACEEKLLTLTGGDSGNINSAECVGCAGADVKVDPQGRYYIGGSGEDDPKKYIINDNGKYETITESDLVGTRQEEENSIERLPSTVNNARALPTTREYVVDPVSTGFLTSVQCVCLPAISGYLTMWRNIFNAIKQCFQAILITGDGSAGMCRAVLTQYICDLALDAIRCVVNAFGSGEGGRQGPTSGIEKFMSSLSDAGESLKESVEGRYGASSIYKTMFVEKKLIHAACLYAFTGDFDLDIGGMLSGTSALPVKSEGFVYPAERRFVGSNPLNNGYATYIYHVGAGLIAGADMNYQLELVCSDDNSCNDADGFVGGRCDCFGKREETYRLTRKFGPGRLSAGQMLGPSEGDIYEKIDNAPYRFDKVRLSWEYKDNNNKNVKDKIPEDVSIRRVGDKEPVDCVFDVAIGTYHCEFTVGKRGYAVFSQEPLPDQSSYKIGETATVKALIEKHSPGIADAASGIDPSKTVLFYLRYTLKGPNGVPIPLGDNEDKISREGASMIERSFLLNERYLPGRMQGDRTLDFYDSESKKIGTEIPTVTHGLSSAANPPTQASPPLGIITFKSANKAYCYAFYSGVERTVNIDGVQKSGFVSSASITPVIQQTSQSPIALSTCAIPSGMTLPSQAIAYNYIEGNQIVYNSYLLTLAADSFPETGMKAAAFIFSSGQAPTEQPVCQPSTFKLEMGLYYCLPKDETQPPSLNNCNAGSEAVSYNNERQIKTVDLKVTCDVASSSERICVDNQLVIGGGCKCGTDTCTAGNQYCYFDGEEHSCQSYRQCDKTTPTTDIIKITAQNSIEINEKLFCDCDNTPGNDMEDCGTANDPNICWQTGVGDSKCVPMSVFQSPSGSNQ
ncbi:MAG TPA: fibronectin type III domain-containing protein [Candidatus Nanoarchaeia archaeon]|nr:fibronectin type III domain-containing protein [Candidatus Nanoarchaeia archaeon]